ncbi:MAG: NAD(P)/FAD-dependent oxidoreductase [Candidatus Zixiibacteriota bacterium]
MCPYGSIRIPDLVPHFAGSGRGPDRHRETKKEKCSIPYAKFDNRTTWRHTEVDIKDVVIVGAGPAGIATAIQLKRCDIEAVLLEQEEIGGLLRNANLIENYPGFPRGISGPDLIELFKKQLRNVGVMVSFERVRELEYKDKVFFAKGTRRVIASAIAVIATGTKSKKISGLPISDGAKGQIFYEIYPIRKVKNKKIAIIGAGDAAFDYALNLSRKNEVIILNRSKRAKCIPTLIQRCMTSAEISYLDNVCVKQINNKGKKLLLTCTDSDSQSENPIYADYVVIAVGREPCLDFLGSHLKRYFKILVGANTLYMIGDVRNKIYRQTAICVGDGIKAAMKIHRKIRREGA